MSSFVTQLWVKWREHKLPILAGFNNFYTSFYLFTFENLQSFFHFNEIDEKFSTEIKRHAQECLFYYLAQCLISLFAYSTYNHS